ncbi:MAG: DUF4124 domain-containing protein [Hyphomicrobium sp.]
MNIPLVLFLSSLALSQAAFADGLYKCKDAKGGTSYQQAACPTTSKTEGIRTYAPVAPSARNSWTAQRDVLQQQQMQRQQQYEAEVPRRAARITTDAGRDQGVDITAAVLAPANTRRGSSSAHVAAPQSTTLRDQHLNKYTQPPSSTFATDNKTGKQCFVNGGFIHC